jgi:hypothetical protein
MWSLLKRGVILEFLIKNDFGQVWSFKLIIPATQKGKIERTTVQGQPRQKIHETSSQQMTEHGGTCLLSSAMQGSTNRRMVVQAHLGIN